jgi:predicted ATP-binding protein involved in virulence
MENVRIESIEITNIGVFEHLKLDFPKKTNSEQAEVHILTGENGTGKSTILMLLTGLADNANEQECKKRAWGSSSYSINYQEYQEKCTFKFRLKDASIDVPLQSEQATKDTVDYAFFAYSNDRQLKAFESLETENSIARHPFVEAVKFDKTIDAANFLSWISTTKTRALVAQANGDKQEYQSYTKAISEIEKALSEITGKSIEFSLASKPYLRVVLKMDGQSLDIDVLPDGIKSTIRWLGDLLMRLENIPWTEATLISLHQNFVLFLDEIEVHLHPMWQRSILPVIQKLFKNAQIFISTHSPFVVGSVDGAWIHKLKKEGQFAILDGEPVLSEDGKSTRLILDEIFGVNQQYGVQVEEDLKKFRVLRDKVMTGKEVYPNQALEKLANALANQSAELYQIIAREQYQLERIMSKTIS